MMLQFEDVLFRVVVDRQTSRFSGHFGLGGLFLGHESSPGSGFCDLYACESGFLEHRLTKRINVCFIF